MGTEEIKREIPRDEDETEGHMPRVKVPASEVGEAVAPVEDDEDTEGHRRHLRS